MDCKNRKFSFYISISTVLVITVLVLTGLFLWITHKESRTAALETADNLFSEINSKTMQRYENGLQSIAMVAKLAAQMPGFERPPIEGETYHPCLAYMFEAINHHDRVYSTYIGYENGSFIQVIALRENPKLFKIFGAPLETAFVLRIIAPSKNGVMKHAWHFLDKDRRVIGQLDNLDSSYDPSARIWYRNALNENTTFFTKPYVFSSSKIPGITCARRLVQGNGAFGVDITIEDFSLSLVEQQISENGLLFLFDRSGKIIASAMEDVVRTNDKGGLEFLKGSQSKLATVRAVIEDYMKQGDSLLNITREIEIDGNRYLMMLTGRRDQLKIDLILASIAPTSDFTGLIRLMQKRILMLSGAVLLAILPLSLFVSKMISSSLRQLELEALKIRKHDFSESASFDSNIKEIHTLIKAFSSMKSTIRNLLEKQRKLFDDFTKLLAGAIDAKSPYTGSHCARVPVISQMLAEAACNTREGPFADFDMRIEDEKWEFEIAAWLHDCGKVTTPEYVVDKATKLETIYNRLHEIRMRFEVLLRDAEIAYYRQRLKGNQTDESLRTDFENEKTAIINDFEFVAKCNMGGEFMADDDIKKLKRIAARTWIRHLDDRIGISAGESELKNAHPSPELPVEENVIADQVWQIIHRDSKTESMADFDTFNMDIPQNVYNRGELYNLCIPKGTLSLEDRFKIQEHIIQTINMLGKLDFPDYLARVPEYAGAHHETIIGTGYPRGLKKEQMSIPARIIAIADIYEALTAADRPYKKAKKLSVTLEIMLSMCREKHIDHDLYNLFLTSGVYKEYAEKYLSRELIDNIDIDDYLYPGH